MPAGYWTGWGHPLHVPLAQVIVPAEQSMHMRLPESRVPTPEPAHGIATMSYVPAVPLFLAGRRWAGMLFMNPPSWKPILRLPLTFCASFSLFACSSDASAPSNSRHRRVLICDSVRLA